MLAHDIRRASRLFRQAPWSTVGIVLILALGTGLNCAVLAVAYGVLFRPLPYADPANLAIVQRAVPAGEIAEWGRRLRTVQGIAGYGGADHTLRGLGDPRVVHVMFVSRTFFDVVGTPARSGRTFGPEGEAPGVIVSERLLAAAGYDDRRAVGALVRIADGAFPILGVMPRAFAIPSETTDVWIPAEVAPAVPVFRNDDRRYTLVARLRPGSTFELLADDATRVAKETATLPRDRITGRLTVTPLKEHIAGAVQPVILALVGAATLVLLVACANVTTLLLGRAASREHETAVQLALGAGPRRILASLLVEGLLLALAGSALGILTAFGAVRVLRWYAASLLPRLDAVRVDLPVLGSALMVALTVAVLCTVAPALHSLRRGIAPLLGQRTIAGLRLRVTNLLVVAQIAISVVILVASALLAKTVSRLLTVELGMNPDHAIAMKLVLGERTLLKPGERLAFVQDMLNGVRALPGVQNAGVGSSLPPNTTLVDIGIRMVSEGRDETQLMSLVACSSGYLSAIGARLVGGRAVETDEAGSNSVVISRSVASHLFQGKEPIGLTLPTRVPGSPTPPRVVGVVDDVRYTGLAEQTRGAIYVPWNQFPLNSVHLVVRANGDPRTLVPSIRDVIHRLDPDQPIANVTLLQDTLASSIADRRLHAFLALSFAALGFVVALVGLVAALGRSVIERRRELAVRAALGATPARTLTLVMSHATRLVVSGIALGSVGAVAAARALGARLFGVTPYDPSTYAAVALVTALIALVACLVPAYRATTLDPTVLLRAE